MSSNDKDKPRRMIPAGQQLITALAVIASILISGMGVYNAVASPLSAPAAMPPVGFTGQLADANGQLVSDGNYELRFSLYGDAVSPTPMYWTESRTVQVSQGVYSVALGDGPGNPLPANAFDGTRWIGVQIGGDPELTPRTEVASVPFALVAEQSMGIQGRPVSAQAPQEGQVLAWNATTGQWEPKTIPTPSFSRPSVRAYHNTSLTIQNATWTALSLNSERWDTNNFHATSESTWGRLTVPTGQGGKYLIFGSVQFTGNTTGIRQFRIMLNGATPIALESRAASAFGPLRLSISTVYDLAAGQYVDFWVYHNRTPATDPLTLDFISGMSPEVGMIRIGN